MFPIDLKSDTVTRPSKAMRLAMAEAEVGDDVYCEDPTVNRLQEKAAAMTGKDAALFLPSGTMGNLVAVLTHCGRGEGAILGINSHIYHYEGGGLAALGGVFPLTADDSSGLIPPPKSSGTAVPSTFISPLQSCSALKIPTTNAGDSLFHRPR